MCQESHDLLVLSPQWSSLVPVGMQPTYDEPGQPQFLELRNCSKCGSSLARPVEQDADLVTCPADYVSPGMIHEGAAS